MVSGQYVLLSPPPFSRMPEIYPDLVKAPRLWQASFYATDGRARVRALTASMNAYVRPKVERYMHNLAEQLKRVPARVIGDVIDIRRKEALIRLMDARGDVGPPKKRLCQRRAIVGAHLEFDVGLAGMQADAVHSLHARHWIMIAAPNGHRAVSVFFNLIINGQECRGPVMLRPVELDAARNPGPGQSDQRPGRQSLLVGLQLALAAWILMQLLLDQIAAVPPAGVRSFHASISIDAIKADPEFASAYLALFEASMFNLVGGSWNQRFEMEKECAHKLMTLVPGRGESHARGRTIRRSFRALLDIERNGGIVSAQR